MWGGAYIEGEAYVGRCLCRRERRHMWGGAYIEGREAYVGRCLYRRVGRCLYRREGGICGEVPI